MSTIIETFGGTFVFAIIVSGMATHILLQELQKYSDFKEEDFPEFLELFKPFKVAKGDYFYRAGDIPKYSPFILKGCMRKFFINEEGDEQIVYFAEEGWFAGEVQCMRMNSATEMYLQALEDCEILGISLNNAEIGLQSFPAYRKFLDVRYAVDHNRIINEATRLKTDTPESLYLRLIQTRPSLILRVPQHYIAAYLGIRTETISRIRRKIAGK
ncbi:Crp/Fnr family transcriptional regulator [Daejeonella lutea]|uniref:cAMP-binding domain of CRP or a regulatory subunit of cAMP-dependent protein kinases n=1 Tax=Daejeonella lutea TaxID=572036 RepID=A0A1T5BPP1_9SPHI|nr:Crp/Fnr family transcriptional regulator [Daejeonella lutea]SKB49137.1 cAMP-binding domain of CRP or a regulatory subunit of cAMP-dependent protein kinases [Daejeonella lutea]